MLCTAHADQRMAERGLLATWNPQARFSDSRRTCFPCSRKFEACLT